jgi:hypothetical protein
MIESSGMRIAVCLATLLVAFPAGAQTKAAPDGVDGRLIGGIALLAVGTAAAAVGIWASVRVNTINGDDGYQSYRARVALGEDACDRASAGVEMGAPAASAADVVSLCDEGNALTIVQAIVYPLAILSGGAASYLLLTSQAAAKEPAVRITPRGGPRSAGVTLTLAL